MPAIKFRVDGSVQGVGFRMFTRDQARRLGVKGWCRNTDDGKSVEGVAEAEESALEKFKSALSSGPGKPTGVEAQEVMEQKFSKFEVRH
ncbi:Acylphosphatase [Atractiella rhizophila]|nr:Acylphosphatase [Atractiella rhizophila]